MAKPRRCCCTQSNIKIIRGRISPIIILVVINSHAYGAWVGVLWENQQEVWVNTTRIAKISANPKNCSNHKYFAGERQVQENSELTQRPSNIPMQNTTGRCKRIIQLNECM